MCTIIIGSLSCAVAAAGARTGGLDVSEVEGPNLELMSRFEAGLAEDEEDAPNLAETPNLSSTLLPFGLSRSSRLGLRLR